MPHVLPQPQQLAALGTVLCLYRLQHGTELAGWAQAAYAEAAVGVDSDGLRESVRFFDRDGRCCWRLHLLPDSDFLAWDRMMTSLPCAQETTERERGVAERLWWRMAGRLLGGHWRACTVRLYALARGASPVLAASLAPVSPLGATTARRIVDAEGVEVDIVSRRPGYEALLTATAAQHEHGGTAATPSL
ncbi:Hemin transport protein [Pseudoxanthomonas sp. UTMC 1351]|uniref:Hemin transport protein n=1 Tax=Pseudoxanthomonas sp. UTMC 1351 TaxID=2695853 RepID=UPI0034CFAE88